MRYASTLPARGRTKFLHDLAEHNVRALAQAIQWCAEHGIFAFRVLSGLLPLYTYPIVGWRLTGSKRGAALRDQLSAAGTIARSLGVRLSFHPDQFVVLGSATESTVRASLAELEYLAECAELLGADQLTLHGGEAGVDPDPFESADPSAHRRALENTARGQDRLGCERRVLAGTRQLRGSQHTRHRPHRVASTVAGWRGSDDFARGHPAATGGSVDHEQFARLLGALSGAARVSSSGASA